MFDYKRCLVLMVGLVVVAGCDQSATPTKPKQAKIAIVISTLNNPWFVVLGETAKQRAEELGHEAVIFDSQNDVDREASTFENITSGGFDAVVFNPTDADASVANAKRAVAAGLPVFCIDREINASDVATSQILSDNYAGCVELGQHFVATVGEEGNYAELLGIVGDNNTWNRSKGFHSVVDRYPNLKMVAQQSAEFDRTKGLDVMESLLQANPDIVAVFCGNDAMALGAYQAIKATGKTEQIKVFGFDGAEDAVQSVAKGEMAATAMQFPKTMARTAVEFADEWFKGRRDFEQHLPVAVELVTPDNVAEYGDYGAKP